MNNLGHKLFVAYQNVASSMKSPLKESVFYKEGKLTPEEFLSAGDFLTSKCPTWKWCGAAKNTNPCLPPDKQYLKTTVPCAERASDYEKSNQTKEQEVGDGWLEADLEKGGKSTGETGKPEKKVMDLDDDDDDDKGASKIPEKAAPKKVLDLDDDDDEEEVKKPEPKGIEVVEDDDEEETGTALKTRTYDVTVTYDLYYCVPRMWLMGYNEKGGVLTTKEMTQDIMSEYRNKTVTIEPHPITGIKNISVHPCRHSMLLKKMIETFEKSGKKLEVYMSILIFLKFLHSVVPTIQYDFTMDISF